MGVKKYAIGLDLGGTSIKFGICSEDGKIIKKFKQPTRADQSDMIILDDLAAAAKEALVYAKSKKLNIRCVGIGTPGTVDVERGHLTGNSPNFKFWNDVPIKTNVEERLGIPVWVDNDANLMAYGEASYGAGIGRKDIVCITLGTGIGGGIILNGALFRGSDFAGTEIGHMSICYNGIPCRCGSYGCWEKYASATAMIANYNKSNPDLPVTNASEIFVKYDENEQCAVEVVNEEIKMTAVGIANLVNIFNPQLIIVGGGISEVGDWFIDKISRHVGLLAIAPAMKNVKIVRAKLGNKAGLLGAAAFAMQMEKQKKR